MFPEHIEEVLLRFGVSPATRAALHRLYLSYGGDALEAFADLAASVDRPVSSIEPEELGGIRESVVRRFLGRHHGTWVEGLATPSFYHPRDLEGQASGITIPLGAIGQGSRSEYSDRVERSVRELLGERQPMPEGLLTVTRHGHYCGRQGTVSFEVVAADLEVAIEIGLAAGRQHSLPGAIGGTTASFDPIGRVGVLWEIQPNVLKPSAERNASIGRFFRRHRNWHVTTLVAALEWLRDREARVFVLRREALAATHQVDPDAMFTDVVQSHYERTVQRVVDHLGLALDEASGEEGDEILESWLLNVGAGEFIREWGAAAALWRVRQVHSS
jgi:hypothetical protein